jgi:hypothetical protein
LQAGGGCKKKGLPQRGHYEKADCLNASLPAGAFDSPWDSFPQKKESSELTLLI